MRHYQVPLLSFYMIPLLVGCGGSSTSNQPTITTTNVDIDISNITLPKISLPTDWEISNQSLINSSLANIESNSRMTAEIANQMPIVQSAKAENASLAMTKQFANNVVNHLTTIKNHHYPAINKVITFTGTKASELIPLLVDNTKIIVNQSVEVDTVININGLKNIVIECQNIGLFQGQSNVNSLYPPPYYKHKSTNFFAKSRYS